MAISGEAFSIAVAYFESGQVEHAEQVCRQIVAVQPGHADAWQLLGVIALQGGKPELAVERLQQATAANSSNAEAWSNLGVARKALGQPSQAIDCFAKAAALSPDFAAAHFNLAHALHESGQIDEALDEYGRALALSPADPAIHTTLAHALRDAGRLNEAIVAYRRALDLQPANAESYYNLGTVYQQAHQDEQASGCYQRAVQLNPNFAAAYSNLGTILKNQGRLAEASICFQQALELQPQDVELNYNWACNLLVQGKLAEGTLVLDRVLQMQPQHAEAHYNRATLRLFAGDFQRGWPEFEWRWKTTQQRPRAFHQPLWDGEPLGGRTILLHAEQGFGDTIQFIRYAALVKQLGGTVVFECQKPLLPLLATCRDIDLLIGQGDALPPFAVHAPLLSLPRILRTDLSTIPAAVPYLFAKPELVLEWKTKLAELNGFRIGINWRGRPGQGSFRQRDIPLTCFAELTALPGVQLISLQKGAGQQDLLIEGFALPILNLGDEIDQEHGPFMDTAAIMANLDLVITSDTSIAHLAGALGVPVWLALSQVPDWRWLQHRPDSPWYPTLRLFRQPSPGNWAGVFQEIKSALITR